MSYVACHLSPDHHSIELQLQRNSQKVWGCGWGRFGDKWGKRERTNQILFEQLKEFPLIPEVFPFHSVLELRAGGGGGGWQSKDTRTLRLTDCIGLAADSVKIN